MSAKPQESLSQLVGIATLSVIANVVMLVILIFLSVALMRQKVEAYGLTDSLQAVPLVPLSAEYVTESRVSSFADECLHKAFEHDFEHFRKSTLAAGTCFTAEGVDSYMSQITPLTDFIQKKRMVMSVTVEPPVILRKGDRTGTYEWEVQSVITIYMTGPAEQVRPQKFVALMRLRRVPLIENARSISTSYLNLSPTT